jgi:hypothetical protein
MKSRITISRDASSGNNSPRHSIIYEKSAEQGGTDSSNGGTNAHGLQPVRSGDSHGLDMSMPQIHTFSPSGRCKVKRGNKSEICDSSHAVCVEMRPFKYLTMSSHLREGVPRAET